MVDITFDLETCSLAPTAAVMSIGAVAWKRYDEHSPFFGEGDGLLKYPTYSAHVDLRSMFLAGFTFDQSTADWWAKQSDEAKQALLANDSDDEPCQPIDIVITEFLDWIKKDVMEKLGDDDLCLWAQGTDFDVAILRYICYKMGIKFGIEHTQFRDHRTFYLEAARIFWDAKSFEIVHAHGGNMDPFSIDWAYQQTRDYKDIMDDGAAHDPLFDCKRSIYSTWQIMRRLRENVTFAQCDDKHQDLNIS